MVKPFVISFLVLALIVISSDRKAQKDGGVLIGGVEASEKKIEFPWRFGGYTEVEELHPVYMSGLFKKDAIGPTMDSPIGRRLAMMRKLSRQLARAVTMRYPPFKHRRNQIRSQQ